MKYSAIIVFALLGFAAAKSIENAQVEETRRNLVDVIEQGLNKTLAKAVERVEARHQQAQDLIEKAKEFVERLQRLAGDAGKHAEQLLKNARERINDKVDQVRPKREAGDESPVDKLVKALQGGLNTNLQKFKERVEVHHGKALDLIQTIKDLADRLKKLHADAGDHARELIKGYRERFGATYDKIQEKVRNPEPREKRLAQTAESLQEFLKELTGHAKKHFENFQKWVQQSVDKTHSQAKDHHARLVDLAKEVRDHAKDMHKETRAEAVEAIRPYREELGNLWQELLSAVRTAVSRDNKKE